jgi:pyruvate-ferredoxin/flavodoxin oxidoreductase
MTTGFEQQKAAVASGAWTLYRFDPRLAAEGKNPLQLDSKEPTISLEEYAYKENRFKMLTQTDPERAKALLASAQNDVRARYNLYKQMAEIRYGEQTKA